jgi:hypothetical protein
MKLFVALLCMAFATMAGALAFDATRPHFTDIASHSPFQYITDNDLSPRKYFVQPMAGGVAIFDYDNDGRMDIFFTNGAKLPEMKKIGPRFHNCLPPFSRWRSGGPAACCRNSMTSRSIVS